EGIDQWRHTIGSNNSVWMLIKGNYQRPRLMLLRIADGLPDDLLMPQMYPSKNPMARHTFLPRVCNSRPSRIIFISRAVAKPADHAECERRRSQREKEQ